MFPHSKFPLRKTLACIYLVLNLFLIIDHTNVPLPNTGVMSPALDISFAAQGTVQQGDIDSPINSPMGKKTRAGKRGAAQPTLLQNTLTKNMATAGRTTRARQVKESAGVTRKGTVTFFYFVSFFTQWCICLPFATTLGAAKISYNPLSGKPGKNKDHQEHEVNLPNPWKKVSHNLNYHCCFHP